MSRILFIILVLILVKPVLFAKDIRIGVFRDYKIEHIEFAYHNGSYLIYGDTTQFDGILPNEFVSIQKTTNNKVEVKHGVKTIGFFDTLTLKPTGKDFALRLRPRKPKIKNRRYQGSFQVFVGDEGLTVVNEVKMTDYLAGVVESEGGGGKHLEYYKAQAVLSRTYALKHDYKHRAEGFNLCDRVHCQAYHNMLTYTDDIRKAVNQTDGIYAVDSSGNNLVNGYFHANCGGQTSPASYVWNTDISYLQPFKDTFCIHTKQATWEKRISKVEWRKYLINNFHYPIQDSVYQSQIYNFKQPFRKAFYVSPHLGIPLRDIRRHFKLKSTFFDVEPDGDFVVLKGRGYGHGIGLCQEGAMNMAKNGLAYEVILKYYFSGLQLVNKYEKLFFNQKVMEIINYSSY